MKSEIKLLLGISMLSFLFSAPPVFAGQENEIVILGFPTHGTNN